MLERYKWAIPWLLAQLGVRKWLSERALHMPERYVEGWCKRLSATLSTPDNPITITPYNWRQIEEQMAAMVYDGVLIEIGPNA